MKGNRQGSLSRSITRRSDQNRKIKYCFYFAILPQLVKKVRSDFFDKLTQSSTTVWWCCFACCSKEGTRNNIYGHVSEKMKQDSADRMEAYMRGTVYEKTQNG